MAFFLKEPFKSVILSVAKNLFLRPFAALRVTGECILPLCFALEFCPVALLPIPQLIRDQALGGMFIRGREYVHIDKHDAPPATNHLRFGDEIHALRRR